jgi:cystine transport system ATP-binding protein
LQRCVNLLEVPEMRAHAAVLLADDRVVDAGASRELIGRPRAPRTAKFVATLALGVPAF